MKLRKQSGDAKPSPVSLNTNGIEMLLSQDFRESLWIKR